MFKATLLIFTLLPLWVSACSCGGDAQSMKERFEFYDVIFSGATLETHKVINGNGVRPSFYKTQMKVQKVWKGLGVTPKVFIRTEVESNSCGALSPTIGNQFLVFGHLTDAGHYATGGCPIFVDLNQARLRQTNDTFMAEVWSALGTPAFIYEK
ncbi:hypothetical protein [Pseudoalteromonas sp. MMG005]|uniref:hypothetical protein n=1 Tax=Pseudoalteromonas sp. MMG005 TaxID=2822682 RepID=UPI001B3A7195|nr:hypothetical protein [Pseudoalteromonas sp. MMG005]MBQ4848163.1 hypothetical protein [Pseudoalteromonas sp. MMG005]